MERYLDRCRLTVFFRLPFPDNHKKALVQIDKLIKRKGTDILEDLLPKFEQVLQDAFGTPVFPKLSFKEEVFAEEAKKFEETLRAKIRFTGSNSTGFTEDELARMARSQAYERFLDRVIGPEAEYEADPQANTQSKSHIGNAYKDFITDFDEKNRSLRMDVYQKNEELTNVAITLVGGDNAWNVICQFVRSDSKHVRLKNPRDKGPLNLTEMFKRTKEQMDNREVFYRFVKTIGSGCNTMYELTQHLVR